MSTQWQAGGVSFPDGPFMVAAGVCKTPGATATWLKAAPVVSGSYTQEQRSGNQGKLAYPDTLEEVLKNGAAFNSYGMPNAGFSAVALELAMLNSLQPLVVSIAGFSVDEYVVGVQKFGELSNIAACELNFGCPNTQDHTDIMSFDPASIERILERLGEAGLTTKPIWLKFSPYSNPYELKRMAELVNRYKDVLPLAVVTCNTFPNAYPGMGHITPNAGLAGMSGPALKSIALGQVRQFRQHLDPSIDIIGVGGVTTGNDIVDFLDAGAAAVQINTLASWAGNPKRFLGYLTDKTVSNRFFEYLEQHS